MVNLIYLHTHDTGVHLPSYGYAVPMPRCAEIFKTGVTFQQAFSVAPTCSPSRAGLLTGQFPHQVGMLGLAQRGFEIDPKKHLAHFLSAHGYETVLCGVQHEKGYYTDHAQGKEALGYAVDLSTSTEGLAEHALTEWDRANAEALCRWLQEKRNRPFFVSFGQHATHREYPRDVDPSIDPESAIPPHELNTPETRNDYARFKTSAYLADQNIGMIYDALVAADLLDETILLFTTDHGIAMPNAKCTLFDRGIHVYLNMIVPGSKKRGNVDTLVSHIDVFPTLCDLLGLEKPDYMEGRTFASIFETGAPVEDAYIYAENNFHTSYEPIRCVRDTRYKYIRYFDDQYLKMNLSNIDDSSVKEEYLKRGFGDREKAPEALYDLVFDPEEANNLAENARYRPELKRLRTALKEWMERTDDPLLQGPIPISAHWKVNRKEAEHAHSKNPEDYV